MGRQIYIGRGGKADIAKGGKADIGRGGKAAEEEVCRAVLLCFRITQ